MMRIFKFSFPNQIQCEDAVNVSSNTLATTNDVDEFIQKPRKIQTRRKKNTTKKYVPTIGGGGHVAGAESTLKKNLQREPHWAATWLDPWSLLTKPLDLVVGNGNKRSTPAKIADVKNPPTSWDVQFDDRKQHVAASAPVDYNRNEDRLKSIKAERLSMRHFRSNCAVELEIFKVCLKDRFHNNTNCDDYQDKFRACQEEMVKNNQ